MARADRYPPVLERLVGAINAHDIDALVSCFADDYVNETPVHPQRGFRGNEQVRRNWTQLFAITDLEADVPRHSLDRDRLWTEWEMFGTRQDGGSLVMRGVVIFGIGGEVIRSARFYLEPVDETGGDVDVHTRHVVGAARDRAGNE